MVLMSGVTPWVPAVNQSPVRRKPVWISVEHEQRPVCRGALAQSGVELAAGRVAAALPLDRLYRCSRRFLGGELVAVELVELGERVGRRTRHRHTELVGPRKRGHWARPAPTPIRNASFDVADSAPCVRPWKLPRTRRGGAALPGVGCGRTARAKAGTVAGIVGVGPPARSVWFDMAGKTEHLLAEGETPPGEPTEGFLWIDLELTDPEQLSDLAERLPHAASALDDGRPAGEVRWRVDAADVHIDLAGARLEGGVLVLDRRQIVIGDGVIASLHRGLPDHFARLRERYRDSFPSFAKSHGFLLFEMCGALVDDLRDTVRDLGDRIDEHRLAAGGRAEVAASSDLLAAVLLLRRILVRTRDLLTELSSRRSRFVPETTQPYLGDMARRLDGMVDDLAFSRDVLSQVMTTAVGQEELVGADAAPLARRARRSPPPGRAPVRVVSLGGFAVLRDGVPVPAEAFGHGRARELLAALLCARREVRAEELRRWLWPNLDADQGGRVVQAAASELRGALEPDRAGDDDASVVVGDAQTYRVALFEGDSWDVEEVLAAADGTTLPPAPQDRLRVLGAALDASRGTLCPEWPYAEWAADQRRECGRAGVAIRASLAEALLTANRPREALVHFSHLADEEPEQESWHRGIMRCHSAAGDRALALRQFHTCRSVLRQGPGTEPSPETHALYFELLKGRSGGSP